MVANWGLLAMIFLIISGIGILQQVYADPIPITNHSFEEPSLADGDTSQVAPGWTLVDSRITNPIFFSALDGENILVIEQGSTGSFEGGHATQMISNVAADTRYVFTFDFYGSSFNNGNGFVTILVNGASQTSSQIEDVLLVRQFEERTLSWDSPSSGPLIGQPLEISFSGIVPFEGIENGILFDNIRLEVFHMSELDDDGDGVSNSEDQCPNEDDTIDTDSDGIPNCIDENPTLFCGEGTIRDGFACVVNPLIVDQLNQALTDLSDALSQILILEEIITTFEELLGEEVLTEDDCEELQEVADKKELEGKEIPGGVVKNLKLCEVLFP